MVFANCVEMKAVNKLAEIMNRKEVTRGQRGRKVNDSDMRKKEKECRKLEQELKQVQICRAVGVTFSLGFHSGHVLHFYYTVTTESSVNICA